jgi:hypothetical protein
VDFFATSKDKKDVFWDVLSCKNGGNVFHDTSLIWENDFAKDEKNTKWKKRERERERVRK